MLLDHLYLKYKDCSCPSWLLNSSLLVCQKSAEKIVGATLQLFNSKMVEKYCKPIDQLIYSSQWPFAYKQSIFFRYLPMYETQKCVNQQASSHGLVVKVDGSQSRGRGFEPRRQILDGCYVDCFTQHNPPSPLNDVLNTVDGSRR